MRVQEFDQTRDGLANGFLVAARQVAPEAERSLGQVRIPLFPQLADRFGQIVGDQTETLRVVVVAGLVQLPAW